MPVFVDTGERKSAKTSLAAGIRGTSPESIRARQQAQDYRRDGAPHMTRTAALKAVKRAAPALGVGSVKLALIDQLFAGSRAIDWNDPGGIGPIVWMSNAHLARAMGMSEDNVRRHLRGLAALGLITYRDGPTCRRHGKRDDDGRIIEAWGIDLSPIAMRHDELVELAEAHEWETREMKRLRRRRTVLHKDIRSLIASAMQRNEHPGPGANGSDEWHHALARLDVIREQRAKDLDGLLEQVALLEVLYNRLEGLYEGVFGVPDSSLDLCRNAHRGVQICTPITTTASTSDSGICSQNGIAHTRRANPTHRGDTLPVRAAYGSRALEEKHGADGAENKQAKVETDRPADDLAAQPKDETNTGYAGSAGLNAAATDNDVLQLSIGLVRNACPTIKEAAPGALDNWQALRASGPALCGAANINPQVFQEASNTLGPDIAIAATAVTLQKANQGDVLNPGAYLRTLTKRGRKGQLHIARSLHGLAERNATDQHDQPQPDETAGQGAIGADNNHHRRGYRHHRAAMPSTPPSDAAARGATPEKADTHGEAQPLPETPQAFPESGSIHFSKWADTVRQNAPKPIPDVDRVADAFRQFCKRKTIDMTSKHVAAAFKTFCRKWEERQ